jgi:hypothetical protein
VVGVSLTSATLIANQRQSLLLPALTTSTASPAFCLVSPIIRINVTGSTIVYLVVKSPTTSAGTMTFTSQIKANRIR